MMNEEEPHGPERPSGAADARCDCDEDRVPGAVWPAAPEGDTSLPWVQRCDNCCRYDNDDDAARAVAAAVHGRLLWAALTDEDEQRVIIGTRLPRPVVMTGAALGIGEDLLRWAGFTDDDGQFVGDADDARVFADALQHSSVPEACRDIAGSI